MLNINNISQFIINYTQMQNKSIQFKNLYTQYYHHISIQDYFQSFIQNNCNLGIIKSKTKFGKTHYLKCIYQLLKSIYQTINIQLVSIQQDTHIQLQSISIIPNVVNYILIDFDCIIDFEQVSTFINSMPSNCKLIITCNLDIQQNEKCLQQFLININFFKYSIVEILGLNQQEAKKLLNQLVKIDLVQQFDIVKKIDNFIKQSYWQSYTPEFLYELFRVITDKKHNIELMNKYEILQLCIWNKLSKSNLNKKILRKIAISLLNGQKIQQQIKNNEVIKQIGQNYHFVNPNYFHYFIIEALISNLTQLNFQFNRTQIYSLVQCQSLLISKLQKLPHIQDLLLNIILQSKNQKSFRGSIAISILNLTNFRFKNLNFSYVNIPYSNLSSGYFHNVNFDNANLEAVTLVDSYFNKVSFKNSNLKNVNFGMRASVNFGYQIISMDLDYVNQLLVVGSEKGHMKIYSMKTKQIIKQFEKFNRIIEVKFSKDFKYLFALTNMLMMWNCQSFDLEKILSEQKNITNFAIGQKSLIFTQENLNHFSMIDFNGKILNQFYGHHALITCLDFSQSNHFIISGSLDDTAKLWNSQTSNLIISLNSDIITSVCITYDDKFLLTAGIDTNIKVWSFQAILLRNLEGHTKSITKIVVSHDSKLLISASEDTTVKLWNILTGALLKTFSGNKYTVYSLIFHPNQQLIIDGGIDGIINFLDIKHQSLIKFNDSYWNTIRCIAISKNEKIIAGGSYDNSVNLWQTKTGRIMHRFIGHKYIVYCVKFTHDDKYLISGSGDKTIRIWNIQQLKFERTLLGHTSWIYNLIVLQDNKNIISCAADKSIKLWDLQTNNVITLLGHKLSVNAIKTSKDQLTLISGSSDRTIKLWDLRLFKQKFSIDAKGEAINTILLTPDQQYCISCCSSRVIKIWKYDNFELVNILEGHSKSVNDICISNDGFYLLSCSFDKSIIIWNLKEKEAIYKFDDYQSSVLSALFFKNGYKFVSTCYDNSLRIMNMQLGEIIKQEILWKLPKKLLVHNCNFNGALLNSQQQLIIHNFS